MSFPRSGHAVVYHLARLYFGDDLVYCDPFSDSHCGCRHVPCVNPARNFAKNHDHGLLSSPGVPILAREKYLIQYRSPVWSVVSNFKVYLKNHPAENTKQGWEKFACRDIFFWNRFVDKWVLDFPPDLTSPHYCVYEDLMADPKTTLTSVLSFLSDQPVNVQKAHELIERLDVQPRSVLQDFDFYEPAFFKKLEFVARERLALLDLPLFQDQSTL